MGLLVFTIFLIGCMSLGKAAEAIPGKEMYENQFNMPNEDAEDIPTVESQYQIQSFDDDESSKVTTSYIITSITLTLCPGQNDYANCAGKYVRSAVTRIRGRPVYFNKAKQRAIFYTGSRWVITSNGYLLTVARDGATGGFYGSHSRSLLRGWSPRYNLKYTYHYG